jgi:exodeoxyribonuclease VII small subunit
MIDIPGEQSSDAVSYERTFSELQETIILLEAGGLTLQQAVETFERGMQLANLCAQILKEAELRVTRVIDSGDPGPHEPAF